MDRRRNPFVPGAGLQPPELAGRDRLLTDASIDMDRILAGRPAKGLILLGLRGVGKTVLLNRLLALADDKGFRTPRIEAPEGSSLPELLTPELRRTIYALDLRQAATHRLRRAASVLANFAKAFRVGVGDLELSVDLAPGEGDTGNLEQDLPRLLVAMAEAAADRRTAVGLFIDEAQYLSSVELAAVIVACHEIAQRNLPFLFIGAGLPQVAALAGKARPCAERLFDYPEIGPLESRDARSALVKPAEAEGVSFDGDAVSEILAAARNFPYFIGPDRRNPGRPDHLRRRGAAASHQQGDGVEPPAWGDLVHRADVRRLHEAADAGAVETRATAPFRTVTATPPPLGSGTFDVEAKAGARLLHYRTSMPAPPKLRRYGSIGAPCKTFPSHTCSPAQGWTAPTPTADTPCCATRG